MQIASRKRADFYNAIESIPENYKNVNKPIKMTTNATERRLFYYSETVSGCYVFYLYFWENFKHIWHLVNSTEDVYEMC